jgi:hypothetical protein
MNARGQLRYWFAVGVCLASATCPARHADAVDDEWTETPYRAVIWLALPQDDEIRAVMGDRVSKSLEAHCRAHFGAAVKTKISFAPQPVAETALYRNDAPSTDSVGPAGDEIWSNDKLFVIAVRRGASALNVVVRELDCRTRLWGPAYEMRDVDLSRADRQIAAAIFRVFRSVGRITEIEKKNATLEMRAGLLASISHATIIPAAGSIFSPVLRRTDRRGQVAPDGTQVVPWTILQVQSADSDQATATALGEAKVQCKIDSGLNAPFRARSRRRVERLGLYITPIYQQTVFELRSSEEPHEPLLGYELHARLPHEKTLTFVGRTRWDGDLIVPRDEHPYKVFYVKHGDVLLARIPCAVGRKRRVTIYLADHRERLRAEAFVRSVEDQLLDLVARREIVASRLRRLATKELITEADIAKADSLLAEVRQLNRPDALVETLQSREARFSSQNKAVQQRIDRMFGRLRKSIRDAMSPDYVINLQETIEQARQRLREPTPSNER